MTDILYVKSGNAPTVFRYCALSVFVLYKHGNGNSSFVRHFAFFFILFFFQFRTLAKVEFFCHLFVFFFHIYCYTDIINFIIFSQLLRCQFLISRNKIIIYKIVTNHNRKKCCNTLVCSICTIHRFFSSICALFFYI